MSLHTATATPDPSRIVLRRPQWVLNVVYSGAIFAILQTAIQKVVRRDDLQFLLEMEDDELCDLGLCRGQLLDIVREGRISAW